MKTTVIFSAVAILTLLPASGYAAGNERQGRARRQQMPAAGPLPEGLGLFDKNGNRQIDRDEIVAVQEAFSVLKKLDRNANGEIDADEIQSSAPGGGRFRSEGARARAAAGFQRVDKNGNRRIDPDEVGLLEKMLGTGAGDMMKRLDQNSNGKLEEAEIARLNERLEKGGASRRAGAGRATPGFRRPPEKPAGTPAPSESGKSDGKGEKTDGETKGGDGKKIEFGS